MFGYANVGFHLGADFVTFDVDGELTAEDISAVEAKANEVIYSNVEVRSYFPDRDELLNMDYRSKSLIEGEVRIVEIVGVDKCACCAPHVAYTGEIGVIKIVDFMRHRGGMRLTLQAGRRAYKDYKDRYEITRRIGALTSTPSTEILGSVNALIEERDKLAYEIKLLNTRLVEALADGVPTTDGNYIAVLDGLDIPEMREFANIAGERIGGMLVLLSRDGDSYKYVISSRSLNLRDEIKAINSALRGRGGGTPMMVSGKFDATVEEITEYFK
jgi:alanyl-tRNA synthetase